ncbi:hypothetical protein I3843_06G026200 [Carya illinoinensis]|nr:hypothetical protein I3843_06G026200 [Carya illinoinensis]
MANKRVLHPALFVDLGTTYSYDDHQGSRTTPMRAAFTDMHRFGDHDGNNQLALHHTGHMNHTNFFFGNFERSKAKEILEGYACEMKNAVEDENVRYKLEPAFKKEIEAAILHLSQWLRYVQDPHTDENEIKKNMERNIRDLYDPIIARIKQHCIYVRGSRSAESNSYYY